MCSAACSWDSDMPGCCKRFSVPCCHPRKQPESYCILAHRFAEDSRIYYFTPLPTHFRQDCNRMNWEPKQILYEDNHLLVINKKPGQLVQGDKTGAAPVRA